MAILELLIMFNFAITMIALVIMVVVMMHFWRATAVLFLLIALVVGGVYFWVAHPQGKMEVYRR